MLAAAYFGERANKVKMIKGKDLRLGNLVKDRGEKVIKIDFLENIQDGYDTKFGQLVFLEGTEVHPMTEYSDYALGIPITIDWLIRLGFKNNILTAAHNDFIWYSNHIGIKGMLGIVKPVDIQYVHQLQNLFYLLTGNEMVVS